jgi:hypothetical protein
MEATTGVKYTKDAEGRDRYVRIDLAKYGDNQLIEDFLDGIEAEARKGEPTYPFDEVMKREFERRGLTYDSISMIEAFLDGIKAEARSLEKEEMISLEEFDRYMDKRLSKNV